MSRPDAIDAQSAAAILSEVTGSKFRHVRALAGGETGAHKFLAPEPVIVKWDTTPNGRSLRGEAVALSERLRLQAGWPVPAGSGIEAFGRSLDVDDFVGQDVVHWDLHPGNLLVEGNNLAAIVDTDFTLVGDPAFDLVMFAGRAFPIVR